MTKEAEEVANLSVDDLSMTTTTETYYPPGKLPLLAGWIALWLITLCLLLVAEYHGNFHSE